MFNGSNCDRKSQLSGILTEPLNPCAQSQWKLNRVLKTFKMQKLKQIFR